MATTSAKTPLVEERHVIATNEDNKKSGPYTMNNGDKPSIIEQEDTNYRLVSRPIARVEVKWPISDLTMTGGIQDRSG